MQAHLEGVLYCADAASDQVAEAINLALALNIRYADLGKVLGLVKDPPRKIMPDCAERQALVDWYRQPIAADARDIRRRATHHHYKKAIGTLKLEVQDPEKAAPYGGPRDLLGYTEAVVDHLSKLEPLIPALERSLACRQVV